MNEDLIFDLLNAFAAFAIVVRLTLLANALNGTTRHCFRATVVALSVAALAWALYPFYDDKWWPKWLDSAFILAVAAYVILDRRRAYKGPST